jgi:hypothetical protein
MALLQVVVVVVVFCKKKKTVNAEKMNGWS